MMNEQKGIKQAVETTDGDKSSHYIPMFESFRNELDEHYDRRERVIKTSRDVTAMSKKIIFSLQRVKSIGSVPQPIEKEITQRHAQIRSMLDKVAADLQGTNRYRYGRQISPGLQEFVEALSFQHYVETGKLISFEEAAQKVCGKKGLPKEHENEKIKIDEDLTILEEQPQGPIEEIEGKGEEIQDSELEDDQDVGKAQIHHSKEKTERGQCVRLPPEDYLLGIFDLVGEMMRLGITNLATLGVASRSRTMLGQGEDSTIETNPKTDIVSDLRQLRTCFETLDLRRLGIGEVSKKMEVMRNSVEKVEAAVYGMVVRGSERPKGWVPDLVEDGAKGDFEG